MRWSSSGALRRLNAIVGAVPPPAAGLQSSAFSGFVGYSKDMVVVQELCAVVLSAVLCPAPDADIGDDGLQAHLRERALAALNEAEAWKEKRSREGWGLRG